jgi:membrane-bound inhibitor of C-type lysozyme
MPLSPGDVMQTRKVILFWSAIAISIATEPAGAQTFLTYHCRDRSEFIAAFYEGDRRAHLQLDGKVITLARRPSLSGSRYVKGNITLRISKTATALKRGRTLTECTAD